MAHRRIIVTVDPHHRHLPYNKNNIMFSVSHRWFISVGAFLPCFSLVFALVFQLVRNNFFILNLIQGAKNYNFFYAHVGNYVFGPLPPSAGQKV